MVVVHPERTEDQAAVRFVHEFAFGRRHEADLVDLLRLRAQRFISLVAVMDGRVVGHILFTPVQIETEEGLIPALGLAPMAVLPEYQRRGIGSELVRQGLQACAQGGHPVVVVLGHPAFYPRFGFLPASRKGLHCEYAVPDEAFMVAELSPGALQGRTGVVKYLPEFSEV
jgi:putative acetyltransferase